MWASSLLLYSPRLLPEIFNLDPIVKSFDSNSSLIPIPEDPLDDKEMKFFMVGGEERVGGKKWRSSKSSAKFEAERVTEGLVLSFSMEQKKLWNMGEVDVPTSTLAGAGNNNK